jgi:3-dehydroquinate dehydratase
LAQSIIRSVKSAGVFQIAEEKSRYNKEFVEEIQESRKSEGVVINTTDLWK